MKGHFRFEIQDYVINLAPLLLGIEFLLGGAIYHGFLFLFYTFFTSVVATALSLQCNWPNT